MVEFAITAPIMVALFLGVVSFGYGFYTYNRLQEAVRTGARFASMQDYDVLNLHETELSCANGKSACNVKLDPATSALAQATIHYVVYGDPTSGTQPVIDGLTEANVSVSVDVKANRPVNTWVTINNYHLATPFGAITLNGKPSAVFCYGVSGGRYK